MTGWAAKAVPLLILAGLCAYANSFTKSFLLDDDVWIVANGKLASDPLEAIKGMPTRPLAMATIVVNHRLGGLKPFGYHLFNVAAHLAAALALYGFVRRTLLLPRWVGRFDATAVPIALAAALVWMLHPLQTQSVTYIIQRCESMMGLFFILGFYTFARSLTATRPGWWYAATVVSFALSGGFKETTIVFPPLVLLYDRAFGAGTLLGALRQRKWFYLAMTVVWVGMLWVTAGAALTGVVSERPEGRHDMDVGFGIQAVSPYEYLLTQAGVIVHYLRLSAWPTDLCFDYQGWPIARSPADVAWQLAVVVGLLGVALWAAVRRPAAGFAAMWFFATLAPTSSVMPIIDVAFEQRMYLPLAALVVLAVVGGSMLVERLAARSERPHALRLAAVVVVGLVAFVLGIRTAARNEVYRSPVAMWEDTVRKNPHGFRSHANLAQALIVAGRNDDAVKASDEGSRIDPKARMPYVNKGAALINQGKLDEGTAALRKAIEVNNGGFPVADNNLGWCLVWANQLQPAEFHFRHAVAAKPDRAEYRYSHAMVLFLLKRDAEAQAQLDEARRLNPEWVATRARINRLVALADDPKPHELRSSRMLQEMFCRLDGDRNPEWLDTLAFAYAAEGNFAAAAAAARRALRAAEQAQAGEWVPVLRERLAAYAAGKPIRPAAKKS
jgi:tetratricopeptide (TPR) repeat protein